MPTPTGSARWGALVALATLLSGRIVVAEDDPRVCANITDREAFQRALLCGCETISLGGELPVMTRAITIEQSVTIDAGSWSIPPLVVGGTDVTINQALTVTIEGGRAVAHRAVTDGERELPRIIDVMPGSRLTLKDTTIEAGTVSGDGEGPPMHTIVRQRAITGDGQVELLGVRTETVLDHLLLLQQSILPEDEPCVLEADARLGPTAAGPTVLTLAENGVVVAALCTVDEEVQDSFDTASARALVLDRVWLDGDASGLDMDFGEANFTFSPIDTPAAVIARESLWTFDTVTRSVVASMSSVTLDAMLAVDVALDGADLVAGMKLAVDRSIFCGLTGRGSVVALKEGENAAATYQRSALYEVEIPLTASTASTTLTLESITLTGSAQLVNGPVEPLVSNAYIEGSWSLSELEDEAVEALRMVGTDCPEGVTDCVDLPASYIEPGTRTCSEVLPSYFQHVSLLAEWPRAMPELDRLVELGEFGDDLEGVVTTTNGEWPCEQQPPRIGAWPGEGCGLPLLAYTWTASEAPDTPADDTAPVAELDSGPRAELAASRNVFGCQGRQAGAAAALCFLLPGLLVRARRRRRPTPSSET